MKAFFLVALLSWAAWADALSAPVNLRVEGLEENVAVVSVAAPRFSFLHDDGSATLPRGVTQTSYRITVSKLAPGASSESAGALLWDSGHVKSANCSEIAFAGSTALASFGQSTVHAGERPTPRFHRSNGVVF